MQIQHIIFVYYTIIYKISYIYNYIYIYSLYNNCNVFHLHKIKLYIQLFISNYMVSVMNTP